MALEPPAVPLRCRACGRPITTASRAIAVAGAHRHRRTNPAGLTFDLGCFDDAPGVVTSGEPSARATWFPGCSWSVALCAACGAHLGWRFSGAAHFHALIVDRLTAEPDTLA